MVLDLQQRIQKLHGKMQALRPSLPTVLDRLVRCLPAHSQISERQMPLMLFYSNFSIYSVLSNNSISMRGNKTKMDPSSTMLLASLLANFQLKRKSWCVQVLKQFILFPDETDSSQKTVSKYDQLIFSDEQIHTMYKKL